MKSAKYNKFYVSKYEYPTVHSHKSSPSPGHIPAKRKVEQRLGRSLNAGTKVRTAGGNWVFVEPK